MSDLLDQAIDNDIAGMRKQKLQSSIAAGIDANPDIAAKAINYSGALNVAPDTVERNLDQVERQKKIETIDYDGLNEQAPNTAEFLGDPDNARAAHDDIDNLRDLELKLSTRWSDVGRAAVAEVPNLFGYAAKGFGTASKRIGQGMEILDLVTGQNNISDDILEISGEGLTAAGEGLKTVADYVGPDDNRRNLATDIFGGLGQVGAQIGTTVVGGPLAGITLMAGSGLGYGYEAAERNGEVNSLKADATAALYAGITGVTEKYGLDALMKGIPAPMKAAAVRELGQVITKLGLSADGLVAAAAPKVLDTAYGGASEALQEATEGLLQNVVDKYLLEEDKSVLDGLGGQAAAGGGVGTLVRGFVNLMVKGKTSMTLENVKAQADTSAQNLTDLIASARAPATATRMTGRFNELVAKISGDDEFYFGPGAAALYQSMPENERAAVFAAVPGLEEKVQISLATGSDIKMRKADFLAHIAPLQTADQFAEHVKAYPSLYSKAELLDENRVKELEEQLSRDAFTEDLDDMAASRRTITDELTRQIEKTAPYDKAQSRKVASLAAEYYTNIFGNNAVTAFRDGLRIANETRAIRAIPKTDPDPFIDQMRAIAKRQAKAPAAETDMLGGKKAKREKSGPTPLIKMLTERGGIKRGSPIAAELTAAGIDPKRYPRLYKKDGALSDIDNIPASEIQGYFDGAAQITEDGNGYADRQWFLDALRDESFGNPILTAEQQEKADADAQLGELMTLLEQRGVDLTVANNVEIKEALDAIADEYAGNELTEPVDMNVSMDIPFQQSEAVGSKAFKNWFGDSKVVDENGEPLVVYHGTTHDITEFNTDRANVENDFGKGFYFTNEAADVATNYAGEGPDLTGRIERRAEQIDGDEDIGMDAAREQARAELSGGSPNTLPVYLSIKNPVEIGGDNPTFLTYEESYDEETDEYGEPQGTLVDFVEGLHNIAGDFDDVDADKAAGHIYEMAMDGGGISADDLIHLLKERDAGVNYAMDLDNGDLAGNEIIRRAFEEAGFDGIIDHTVSRKFKNMKGMNEGTTHYIAFNPTQIKSVFNQGTFDDSNPNILMQGNQGKYRGYISPLEYGRYMIALGKDANRSTMLHEFGHLFLYQLRDAKENGLIRPEKIKVYDDAVAWLKGQSEAIIKEGQRIAKEQGRGDVVITEDDVQRVLDNGLRGAYPGENYAAIGMQELFARNFETYLMEGKAPSLALRRAFQSFKAWLVGIYRTVQNLSSNLDDDLRNVFDRMLASDQDIEAARSKTEFKPLTAEQFGGTADDYTKYLQQYDDAIEFAKEDVLRQYLDQLNNEQSESYRKHLKTVEAEVRAEMDELPVYQAMNGLAEGVLMDDGKTRVKISKKLLQKGYKWDVLAALSKEKLQTKGFIYTTTKNGISPDAAAEMFGYESGDQMLRDIIDASPYEQAIEQETRKRTEQRYGKPSPDAQAAAEAIRSDKHALMLQSELQAIGLRLGRPVEQQRQVEAQEAAARIIGRRPFNDAISPETYLAAERKAAAAAYSQLQKGNSEAAFDEKRKQIANYYLYKAAVQADLYQEQAFRKLKYTKKVNKKLKGIDGDYADLVRMMMQKIGLRPGKYDAAKTFRQLELIDPMDRQEMAAAMEFILAETPADYREMPFQEFKNAVDAMMNVGKMGRARRKITIEGEKFELQSWRSDVADTFRNILGDKGRMNAHDKRMNGRRMVKSQLLQAYAWLRRVEYWVTSIEGDNVNGPLHRAFRSVKNASLNYRQAEKEWDRKFVKMLDQVKGRFGGDAIAAPELGGYTFENRGEVIGMLHHIGNQSNLQKLINGRVDPDTKEPTWTYEGLQLFIQRMAQEGVLVKADMDYVQSIWDELEAIKPQAQKVHKDLYGYRFAEITAQAVDTPWGQYRGGYFPARTDAMIVEDAQINQDKENLLNNNASFMFPSTGKGFSNSRVDTYAAPLDMKASMVVPHVRSVLRFIHLQPSIRNVGRLFNDKGLRDTIAAVDPHVIKDTIIPWLQRAALQSMEAPSGAPQLLQSFSRWARRRASGAAMFFNVVNTLQQVLGIAPTAHRIGYVNFGKGIATYLRHPVTIHRQIRLLSKEMTQRSTVFENNARGDAQAILEGKVFTEENGFIKNGMAALGNLGAFGDRMTYVMQSAFQVQLDNISWIASFNAAVGKGMDDKAASDYADKVVRETQVSNAPEDIARAEQQTAFLRMFTLFSGWFNGMMNLNNSIVSRLVRERGTAAAMGIAWAVFNVKIVPYVGGQMIYDFFKGGLPADDDDDGWVLDDWASYVMLSMAQNTLNEVPVAGQVINYGITKYFKKQFNTGIRISPVISTAESVVNSLGSVPEALFYDGDESKAWRDGLNLFYVATGIPVTGQVTKSAAFLADVHEGDVRPQDTGDYVKGILVGSPAK